MNTRSSCTAGRVPSSLTGREIVACPPSRLSTAATTAAGFVVVDASTVVDDTGTGGVMTTGDEPLSIGTAPSVAAVAVHAVTRNRAPARSGSTAGTWGSPVKSTGGPLAMQVTPPLARTSLSVSPHDRPERPCPRSHGPHTTFADMNGRTTAGSTRTG